MSVNSMVVAFDETDGAKRALALAGDLAEVNKDAHIDLVYVAPIPLLDETQQANFKEIMDIMISDGEEVLQEAVESLPAEVAQRTDTLILTGASPATEIIKLADQKKYDLLVIGNRGLTGVKEYLGSVSHKVLHNVSVPVLIAK